MKRFAMLLFILLLPVMLIHAQEPPLPLPLAVEYQDKLYVMTKVPHSLDDLPASLTLIGDLSHQNYDASWSPDGTKLVYRGRYIWDGKRTFELPVSEFQMDAQSWTRDGQILYVQLVNMDSSAALIYTLEPKAGAEPKVIARLPLDFACCVGTDVPMMGRLWSEVGKMGLRPLWALTDYGLVYPAEWLAKISLFRPSTGENFTLANGALTQAVLSPNESRLAGIVYDHDSQTGKIVVVDLPTLAETTLVTTESVAVVAWGNDGSLYYAAASQSRNLLDGFSSEKAAQVLSLLPDQSPYYDYTGAYRVRLYRHAPDGTETLLHEQDAYAVGTLIFKDHTLIYSTIANGDAWIQAVADGTLTGNDIFFDADSYMSTTVNYITFNDDGSIAQTGALPGDLQGVAVPG